MLESIIYCMRPTFFVLNLTYGEIILYILVHYKNILFLLKFDTLIPEKVLVFINTGSDIGINQIIDIIIKLLLGNSIF